MNKTRIPIIVVLVLCASAIQARAGQQGHQMAGMDMAAYPCRAEAQRAIEVVDAANRRIEIARQSNSASEMRSAVDVLQAALIDMKVKFTKCVAAPPPDSMAGMDHSMMTGGSPAQAVPSSEAMPGMDHSSSSPAPQTSPRSSPPPAASSLDITLTSKPNPPKTGNNEWEVTVKQGGKPVTNADVSVMFVMPAMPQMKMPEMRNQITLKPAGEGRYAGSGEVMMGGQYNVTISVKQNGKEIGQKKLTVTAQ